MKNELPLICVIEQLSC